jgi:hypothetical protein
LEIGSHLGWLWTSVLLISASLVARITGVTHPVPGLHWFLTWTISTITLCSHFTPPVYSVASLVEVLFIHIENGVVLDTSFPSFQVSHQGLLTFLPPSGILLPSNMVW